MKTDVRNPIQAPLASKLVLSVWTLSTMAILSPIGIAGQSVGSTSQTQPKPAAVKPRISPASFTRDMPFEQAIQILRQSTKKPLNIVVYWKEIADNAGVFPETPIGIDGVTGLGVGQHLQLLLGSISSTSTTRLGYVVNRGVIVIATVERLPKPQRVTRVYDISDLVAPPSMAYGPGMWGGFGGGMGMRSPMGAGGFGQYGGLNQYGGGSGNQSGMLRSTRGRTGRR